MQYKERADNGDLPVQTGALRGRQSDQLPRSEQNFLRRAALRAEAGKRADHPDDLPDHSEAAQREKRGRVRKLFVQKREADPELRGRWHQQQPAEQVQPEGLLHPLPEAVLRKLHNLQGRCRKCKVAYFVLLLYLENI